jgi:hypothetical protein
MEAAGTPMKVSQDGIELKTKSETTVTTFDLTYPPGSFSGWHSHPGIVIVVVKSGTVIRQTGCDAGETFTVGDTVHRGRAALREQPGHRRRCAVDHADLSHEPGDNAPDEPAPVCD